MPMVAVGAATAPGGAELARVYRPVRVVAQQGLLQHVKRQKEARRRQVVAASRVGVWVGGAFPGHAASDRDPGRD